MSHPACARQIRAEIQDEAAGRCVSEKGLAPPLHRSARGATRKGLRLRIPATLQRGSVSKITTALFLTTEYGPLPGKLQLPSSPNKCTRRFIPLSSGNIP